MNTADDTSVPRLRRRQLGNAKMAPHRDFVLYWMIGHRRTRFNFALERAVEVANELGKPLLVLEALRCGYHWANQRHHRFILEGMADNHRTLTKSKAGSLAFVERAKGDGSGLLGAITARACVVVTDDAPVFFLPRMLAAAAEECLVALEVVDSNGLLPLRAADRVFARAYDFRRFLQKSLAPHLLDMPAVAPLDDLDVRWSEQNQSMLDQLLTHPDHRRGVCTGEELDDLEALISSLPIDQAVGPGAQRGGPIEGSRLLDVFVEEKLDRYVADRNALDDRAASELSAHLHYGHVSSHEILIRIGEREDWTPMELESGGSGQRLGWWGLSAAAESFLDELVTWRELGYNMAWQEPEFDTYDSLPTWAQTTLAEHEGDQRPITYTLDEMVGARTHDEIWNAAQRELRRDGRIHNYLRMLWGKKILEWSPSPRVAAEVMVELNNRYSLDGRDPNSYSGIYWCLGRYDRAWGPERPIFGKIRFMSSDSTRRKMKLKNYLETYGPSSDQGELF